MAIETRYGEILRAATGIIARRGFHQASTRDIAKAAGLSLAGLYHYVGGKDELLFLVLDRSLTDLLAALEPALASARTPELKLLALIQTHLDFGFHDTAALKIINRDYELLAEPRRSEIVAKRGQYLQRGLAVLRELDPHGRSGDELLSATNLLLGMLNGIATRPFVRSHEDARTLAAEVTRSSVARRARTTGGSGSRSRRCCRRGCPRSRRRTAAWSASSSAGWASPSSASPAPPAGWTSSASIPPTMAVAWAGPSWTASSRARRSSGRSGRWRRSSTSVRRTSASSSSARASSTAR